MKRPSTSQCEEALAHSFSIKLSSESGPVSAEFVQWTLDKQKDSTAYIEALDRCVSDARVSDVQCILSARTIDEIEACGG